MRCSDLQGLLAGLVAGDLTPAQEEFVRLHLQGCTHCQGAYAGLLQTRRQLQELGGDPYHPRLTGRITRALSRHRARRAVLAWTGRGLRAAGALAAVALVIGLVIWQRGPLQQAAAPPPAEPVYLVAGTDLLYLEAPGKEAQRVATLPPEAELLPDGFLRFGSALNVIHLPLTPVPGPSTARVTDSLPSEVSQVVGDDRSAWLVRQTGLPPTFFLVDRLDLSTGRTTSDVGPKEGEVYQALLSPDSAALYLLARAGDFTFVKVIDPQSSMLRTAHRLTAGFGPGAQMLPSPDGARLYLVDQGRLLVIDQARSAIALDSQVPGLTPVAAISPDGNRILSARPGGGLSLVDGATGRIIRQSEGHSYRQLIWRGGWVYGLRSGAVDLIDPAGLKVKRSTPVPTGTTRIQLP